MTDVFRNYVIQKFFEYGNASQRKELAVIHSLLMMINDQYGNYVQKIFEMCAVDQRVVLVSRVRMHASALKKYTYGKYIVTLEQPFGEDMEEQLPGCLKELAGKEYVLQIRVTPHNFTLNHYTFTVSTIAEDLNSDNVSESDTEEPLPITDVRGGVSTAPSSSTVIAPVLDVGHGSGNPYRIGKRGRSLKRHRE